MDGDPPNEDLMVYGELRNSRIDLPIPDFLSST
jgi:hypothetical protein